MANRHDRRRTAKLVTIQQMTLSELLAIPSGCAWAGCAAHTTNPDGNGWSKMVLYRGKTQSDFLKIDARLMDRDCVLCPDHARELETNLFSKMSTELMNVAGRA